jgi:protein transport protein HofC
VDVQQGDDWCESLARHNLIKPADEAVLQSALRAGNLGWALRQLAGSQRRRFAYRVQTLSQITFPPVVIIAGIVVAVFVVGCFVPLVDLIVNLT